VPRLRPRVAPATGTRRAHAGQVAVHVRVHRARHVAAGVLRRARRGIGERVAAVDQHQVLATERRRKLLGLYQGGPLPAHAPSFAAPASPSRWLYRIEAVTPQIRCGTRSGTLRNSSTSRRRPAYSISSRRRLPGASRNSRSTSNTSATSPGSGTGTNAASTAATAGITRYPLMVTT